MRPPLSFIGLSMALNSANLMIARLTDAGPCPPGRMLPSETFLRPPGRPNSFSGWKCFYGEIIQERTGRPPEQASGAGVGQRRPIENRPENGSPGGGQPGGGQPGRG